MSNLTFKQFEIDRQVSEATSVPPFHRQDARFCLFVCLFVCDLVDRRQRQIDLAIVGSPASVMVLHCRLVAVCFFDDDA
jgi:hypothetical protein